MRLGQSHGKKANKLVALCLWYCPLAFNPGDKKAAALDGSIYYQLPST